MAENTDKKTLKADRRLMKKRNRVWHALQTKGVPVSKKTSQNIVIYNAGLENGTTRELVYSMCTEYGDIIDIVMLPQKPYSFVSFSTVSQAELAHEKINGVKSSPLYTDHATCFESTLLTFFVEDIPQRMSKDTEWPEGLVLETEFISEKYESELLATIDWEDSNSLVDKKLKHRKVKHYGYEFKYSINNVNPDEPLSQGIPAICDQLIQTAQHRGLIKHPPDQLTVNQYSPGQGIPPHVDTPEAFEDGLMSLSLGSQVVMEFSHPDGHHVSVVLPPRSLLVMSGQSRYVWSHAITPRKSDIITSPVGGLTLATRGTRTSLTFRKIIRDQKKRLEELQQLNYIKREEHIHDSRALTDENAARLESEHVHKVYEEIASHFSQTRHSAWPRIADFVHSLPTGTVLADIGCGNGKYLGLNKHIFEIGSDRSENLAGICFERGHEAVIGDVLSIPLRSDMVDVCLCIAVIHHLSTQTRRQSAVRELVRILSARGKLLIYVWAMEQERNRVKSLYLKDKSDIVGGASVNHHCELDNPRGMSEPKEDADRSLGRGLPDNTNESNSGEITQSELVSSTSHVEVKANVGEKSPSNKECSKQSDNLASKSKTTISEVRSENLSVHVNRTQFKHQDMLVPWQLKKETSDKNKKMTADSSAANQTEPNPGQSSQTFHRYYHVFKQGELETLCKSLPNIVIRKSYYDQGNWCVLLEKVSVG